MKIRTLFNNTLSRFNLIESSKEKYLRRFKTVIKKVSKQEMFTALGYMKANTFDWYQEYNSTEYPEQHSQRQHSFMSVYKEIEKIYQDTSKENLTRHHLYFVCSVQNIPIGIMIFSPASVDQGADTIGYLLTHPGNHGCGSLLVEKAVELSSEGEIWVKAKPYSIPFYKNLGFEQYGFNDFELTSMRLVFSDSEKWVYINNKFRLKKYI
ncbi:GNAT family N-acetyltransferase [Xenorhabdus bharatensis]|uniref:GNAT family N-acetyltransferase n=1 Tax=Xenorhabdus bharatensis TaxID=3136256 RepID=UPI0030F48822